jgi:hypothetical protein
MMEENDTIEPKSIKDAKATVSEAHAVVVDAHKVLDDFSRLENIVYELEDAIIELEHRIADASDTQQLEQEQCMLVGTAMGMAGLCVWSGFWLLS